MSTLMLGALSIVSCFFCQAVFFARFAASLDLGGNGFLLHDAQGTNQDVVKKKSV
jgi:hypothetical protein